MRKAGWILVLLALGAAWGLGWRWFEDRNLPQYEGRSLRSWFLETCRLAALTRGIAEERQLLENQMTVLDLGTNTVPFLVAQAMSDRRDGWVRAGLRRKLMEMPDRRLARRIVPFAVMQSQAAWLLRPLRPPADLVIPEVLPALEGADTSRRAKALALLACLGDGAETAAPWLVKALDRGEDPWVRAGASVAILGLGARLSGSVDAVGNALDPAAPDPSLLRWLADLGPVASNTIPRLEEALEACPPEAKPGVVIALLNIRPNHEAALALMRESVGEEVGSTSLAREIQDRWVAAWIHAPRRPNPAVAALIEPLARVEILAWKANRASYIATRAMERVGPERVRELYLRAMDGPAWIHAAPGLLRLDRNDAEATRRLVAAFRVITDESLPAVMALREAATSNAEAMHALEAWSQRAPGGGGAAVPGGDPRFELIVRDAAYVLTRIRFREWMETSGDHETEY
ncbi:MAG: hypothetical protein AB7O66_25320 [Limisphaerales bacterium]